MSLLGQQLFPSNYPINQPISTAPVASTSASIIAAVGPTIHIHPDLYQVNTQYGPNSQLYGIPFNVVHGNSPPQTINVIIDNYPGDSDIAPVPMPLNPVLEGDYQGTLATGGTALPNNNGGGYNSGQRGDSHLIVWDEDNNIAYELFGVTRPADPTLFPNVYGVELPHTDGLWHAAQESVWHMSTNYFRTLGFTSADAAGLSILACLIRPDEALPVSSGGQGAINHAIRVTINNPNLENYFRYPGSHSTGDPLSPTRLPYGARLRLKNNSTVNTKIAAMGSQAQIVATAMQAYGIIVADGGTTGQCTGSSFSVDANNHITVTWNQTNIASLGSLQLQDFDVVDLTPVVTGISPPNGAGGDTVTVNGAQFSGAAGMISVLFGGTTSPSITVLSDTQISAVVPSGTGTVHVQVQSGITTSNTQSINYPIWGNGLSVTSSADQFTYASAMPPAITGISPSSGSPAGGTIVTITGTNLGGASSVDVGGSAGSILSNQATQTVIATPAGAVGTVDITVTTAAGTSPTSSADQFTYKSAPVIPPGIPPMPKSPVTITAFDNLLMPSQLETVPGIVVNISGSNAATNYVEYLSSAMAQWQETGQSIIGDGTVFVGTPPLDTTMAYQIRVRSVSGQPIYSNVVIVCPTNGFQSEMTNIIIGLQTFLTGLNLLQIANHVYRAEMMDVFAPLAERPGILLQKGTVAEKRKTLDNQKTNWQWPITLQVLDSVVSPVTRDEIHNYWRQQLINYLDRQELATYKKCKRIDIEPGAIQGTAIIGAGENKQGFSVWISELKLWCETDLLIGRYKTAQALQINSAGSGYAVNDKIVLSSPPAVPGKFVPAPVELSVQTILPGGAIDSVNWVNTGFFLTTNVPPNPLSQQSTTGNGSGATFYLNWGQ